VERSAPQYPDYRAQPFDRANSLHPAKQYPASATSFGSIGRLRPAETGSFAQIGVSMTPGCTVLTRIPSASATHSVATAFANRRTPHFVAR
jgi:hypothetical protein